MSKPFNKTARNTQERCRWIQFRMPLKSEKLTVPSWVKKNFQKNSSAWTQRQWFSNENAFSVSSIIWRTLSLIFNPIREEQRRWTHTTIQIDSHFRSHWKLRLFVHYNTPLIAPHYIRRHYIQFMTTRLYVFGSVCFLFPLVDHSRQVNSSPSISLHSLFRYELIA